MAMACICAVESPCASKTTASGLPPKARSVKTSTVIYRRCINLLLFFLLCERGHFSVYRSTLCPVFLSQLPNHHRLIVAFDRDLAERDRVIAIIAQRLPNRIRDQELRAEFLVQR